MPKIESANYAISVCLMKKSQNEWSRSHFSEESKCEMLLNSLCDCFNESILIMLVEIQMKLMHRIQLKLDKLRDCNKSIYPKLQKRKKKLKKFSDTSHGCIL